MFTRKMDRGVVANGMCAAVALRDLWRVEGIATAEPTQRAVALLKDPGNLSASQTTMLRLAWDVWSGTETVSALRLLRDTDGDAASALGGFFDLLSEERLDNDQLHGWAEGCEATADAEEAEDAVQSIDDRCNAATAASRLEKLLGELDALATDVRKRLEKAQGGQAATVKANMPFKMMPPGHAKGTP